MTVTWPQHHLVFYEAFSCSHEPQPAVIDSCPTLNPLIIAQLSLVIKSVQVAMLLCMHVIVAPDLQFYKPQHTAAMHASHCGSLSASVLLPVSQCISLDVVAGLPSSRRQGCCTAAWTCRQTYNKLHASSCSFHASYEWKGLHHALSPSQQCASCPTTSCNTPSGGPNPAPRTLSKQEHVSTCNRRPQE